LRNNTTEKQRWWVRQDVFITYNKYGCDIIAPPTNIFTSTWDTTQAGSASDTIVLPYAGGNNTFWGDGTINTSNTHTYSSGGIKTINIEGAIAGWAFNNGGDKSKILSVDNTGGIFTFDSLAPFSGCNNMSFFDSSSGAPVTSTNIGLTFRFCSSLSTINVTGMDLSIVRFMTNAFQGLPSAPDIIGIEDFNISSMENMSLFLDGIALPTSQYSELLVNYEAQSVQNNVSFSGGNSQYSAGAAATARAALIADHNWTIVDGGQA